MATQAHHTALKGVVLDINGTLLDSNDAHAWAWVETLRRHGHELSFVRVRPLIGQGGDKMLPQLTCIDPASSLGQQILHDRAALFTRHYLPDLEPTRGARALVARLRNEGFRLVVATSSTGEELKGLLCQATELTDRGGRAMPEPGAMHRPLPGRPSSRRGRPSRSGLSVNVLCSANAESLAYSEQAVAQSPSVLSRS